jgi:hypothetical protein
MAASIMLHVHDEKIGSDFTDNGGYVALQLDTDEARLSIFVDEKRYAEFADLFYDWFGRLSSRLPVNIVPVPDAIADLGPDPADPETLAHDEVAGGDK